MSRDERQFASMYQMQVLLGILRQNRTTNHVEEEMCRLQTKETKTNNTILANSSSMRSSLVYERNFADSIHRQFDVHAHIPSKETDID